jgi:hypothetical protein
MGETRKCILHLLRKCCGKTSVRFRCSKDDSTRTKLNDWLDVTWLDSGYVPVSQLCAYDSKSWGPVWGKQWNFVEENIHFDCVLQNATLTILTFACRLLSASGSLSGVKHRHNIYICCISLWYSRSSVYCDGSTTLVWIRKHVGLSV